MKQREYFHVAALVLWGIAIRIFLFEKVGVWRDWGFYAYNAELILQSQTPFIDFLGRSPLFIYGYALVYDLVGNAIYSLRAYVLAWWLLGSPLVYLVGREIRDHITGLAALGIYLFSPFGLVYMMWVNTMAPAGVAGILAVYVILRWDSWPAYAVAGFSIGVGFLSRRSIIVMLPALGLFLGLQYARSYSNGNHVRKFKQSVSRLGASVAGFTVAMFTGYLLLSNWSLEIAWALFETHAVNLFITFGRGGWPLLGVNPPPVIEETAGIPIISTLCQRCGVWTLKVFAKTFIVTLPVGMGLLYYFRDVSDSWLTDSGRFILGGLLTVLAAYGLGVSLLNGFYTRGLGVLAALVLGYVVFTKAPPEKNTLYSRGMVLLGIIMLGFAAGYLYRNRLLHTYYFMDFWPYFSVAIGVISVAVVKKLDLTGRQLLAIGCVIGLVAAFGGAYPLTQVVLNEDESDWYTPDRLAAVGDDLDERTNPGDVVFSGQPAVVAVSHAKLPNDNARIYGVAANFHDVDRGPHNAMYRMLIDGFRSGEIRYVVYGKMTNDMMRWNQSAEDAFEANYCRVDAGSTYSDIGSTLYEWRKEDCPTKRPVVEHNATT